jgi:hypothetical protein
MWAPRYVADMGIDSCLFVFCDSDLANQGAKPGRSHEAVGWIGIDRKDAKSAGPSVIKHSCRATLPYS